MSFADQAGRRYRFVTITDLGLCRYATDHHDRDELSALTQWIRSQKEVLLRVGLSRRYQSSDGKDGYWLQINGLYTFPDCHRGLRGHW